ncbi:preprotein translocase subunit YajC [Streptomyces nanhaiensis]|uniref:preprotein translocase subunit YajC n=1 Tax=Streptomyces nanhaiensis TaxID=679319 RepID=UPI00399CE443
MDIGLLLPFIILIGAMLLMTRSAKKKQQQAMQMRDRMEPGTGIRTIGGMYALVKEVHSDTVLLEVAPGVHAVYAKNAVGAVLEADEYERIVNGEDHDADTPVVPDDASSLVSDGSAGKTDLSKTDPSADDAETGDAKRKGDTDSN